MEKCNQSGVDQRDEADRYEMHQQMNAQFGREQREADGDKIYERENSQPGKASARFFEKGKQRRPMFGIREITELPIKEQADRIQGHKP